MLNFKKSAILAGLGLALATSAFAAPNSPYFQVHAGYVTNNSSNSVDTGAFAASVKDSNTISKGKFGYGAAIGYQFDNNLRADISYTALSKTNYAIKNTAAVVPVNTTKTYNGGNIGLLMANVYYDFADMNDSIVPYVTAGVGMGMVSKLNVTKTGATETAADITSVQFDSKNKFAYSLGLGVSSKISDQLTLDVGYKFTQVRTKGSTSTVTTGDYLGYNYNNNAFLAGVRFSF